MVMLFAWVATNHSLVANEAVEIVSRLQQTRINQCTSVQSLNALDVDEGTSVRNLNRILKDRRSSVFGIYCGFSRVCRHYMSAVNLSARGCSCLAITLPLITYPRMYAGIRQPRHAPSSRWWLFFKHSNEAFLYTAAIHQGFCTSYIT